VNAKIAVAEHELARVVDTGAEPAKLFDIVMRTLTRDSVEILRA